MLVTTPEASLFGRLIRAQVVSVKAVVTAGSLRRPATAEINPQLVGESLALLQYTSGSTGDPKGVVLTHTNLLANIRALGEALGVGLDDGRQGVALTAVPYYAWQNRESGAMTVWINEQ